MIDLSNPEHVKAEAERRARLRAEGRPLHAEGGVARAGVAPAFPTSDARGNGQRTTRAAENVAAVAELAARQDEWYSDASYVSIGSPPVAWRRGDVLWLRISATARPKKNSTHLGIKKSPGYLRFRNAVVGAVEPFARELRLPLPPIDYNCAAHFYRETDNADTDNLISGLADALQDAGVIADDFRIRTWDGTDRFLDVTRPRVELTLTPYLGGHR